jgi:hypothetical protein
VSRLALLAAVLAFAGCVPLPPTPVPTPVADAAPIDAPAPIPADRFTRKVFDCHLDVVAVERDSAKGDVGYCLAAATTISCLIKLGQYNDATVACLARDLGAKANADVLAGSTNPDDAAKADGARWFILTEQLGYK